MLHWLSSCSGKRKLIEVTELNKLQWTSSSVPKPEGAAVGNYLIQYALALVLKESFKIYCAVNDGIINLIDKVTIDVASPEAGIIQEFIAKEGDTVEPGTKIAIISKSAEGAAAPPKNGPYMWNPQWCSVVKRISQGTPPLVVSLVKWLEDELELNALHNPSSCRLSGNEKAAASQRSALSAALGGRVDVNTTSVLVTTVSLYDMY